jgi:cyanate permease
VDAGACARRGRPYGGGFGALRSLAGRALAAYFGLQAFLFFLIVAYLPQYARDSGADAAHAALLLSIFSLIAMVGS